MFSATVAVVAFVLPPLAANVWADALRRDNAQLTKEVEALELDVMVAQYQSGRSVPVENITQRGYPADQSMTSRIRQLRRYYRDRLKAAILQGRTSPEPFVGILRQQAELEVLVKRLRESRRWPGLLAESDRRPFPELAELRRANYALRDRKHRLAAELSQLQGNSPRR
jgi:hypothetical protein